MTTNRTKLLLAEEITQAGRALLDGRDDIEVVYYARGMPHDEYLAHLADAHGVALYGKPMPAADVAAARQLRVVARIGVGYDAVDVPACTRAGIPLMVVGTANSLSVAESAIGLMFALAKRTADFHAMMREGRWDRRFLAPPLDLAGRTLLVVGFGRIGTRTASRCRALEMRVMVHDPYVPAETIRAAGYEPAPDLDAAVAAADVVSIHCPRTPQTVGMFDAARLARMKPTAFIVNTARGGIIDEDALHAALTSGRLAGAGLDVFVQEPTPAAHPLLALPNVVAAPHMAGNTVEAMDRMSAVAVRNIIGAIDGNIESANVVNREVLR